MGDNNQDKQQGFAAVKPEEKSFDKTVVGGVALVIIIILGAVGYWVFGVDKGGEVALEENQNQESGLVVEQLEEEDVSFTELAAMAANSGAASAVVGLSNFTNVNVAVLADPELFDYHNSVVRGCDVVVLTNREIVPTPRVLNAALDVLFNEGDDYGFEPGNFIATQKKLELKGAIIEGRTAKVFLAGEVGPINGVCDTPRIEAQIQETALQFSTVNVVEIYLNDEPLKIEE